MIDFRDIFRSIFYFSGISFMRSQKKKSENNFIKIALLKSMKYSMLNY